jgi:ABC-2 type transport system ATP-binding protein
MCTTLVTLSSVAYRFSEKAPPALEGVTASIPTGGVTGLVGPDGAGKTTLLRLMAGLLVPSEGTVTACGLDTVRQTQALRVVLGYMPQRFGLYEDLTVMENLRLYADLQNVTGSLRRQRFAELLAFTGLTDFGTRLAGRLSGGMKQKLGLACSLIKKPTLLLLDEPSVGVDPISRRELWRMVKALTRQAVTVVWSTAYLDEAEQCDRVLLLNQGRLLFAGPPADLTNEVRGRSFQIRGLPQIRRRAVLRELQDRPEVADGVVQGRALRVVLRRDPSGAERPAWADLPNTRWVPVPARFEDGFLSRLGSVPRGDSALARTFTPIPDDGTAVVEARGLTKRFGGFTAVHDNSFSIKRGEIFGLLGPNGAGKSTTFKMMCGLIKPTEGRGLVAGLDLRRAASQARARLGYMAQKFSLYGDLSVRQNLRFFSGAYGLAGRRQRATMDEMVQVFSLEAYLNVNARDLALGFKQRLALACAVMHRPEVLFLDEPTSGVDPLTRREFWIHINGLVAHGVTILITTHFMDEAEYCDRIGLIYRGEKIAEGSPDALKDRARSAEMPDPTLEDAFVALIRRWDREREGAA